MKKYFLLVCAVGLLAGGCCCRPAVTYHGQFGGYQISSYYVTLKTLNGLAHDVEIRYGKATKLEPGAEISIALGRFGGGHQVIVTAAVLDEEGKIIGTAEKRVHIPSYSRYGGNDGGEIIWHITSYTPFRH